LGEGDLSLPACAGRRSEARTGQVRNRIMFLCALRAAWINSPENRSRTTKRPASDSQSEAGHPPAGKSRPPAVDRLIPNSRASVHENKKSCLLFTPSLLVPAGPFASIVGLRPRPTHSPRDPVSRQPRAVDLLEQSRLAISAPRCHRRMPGETNRLQSAPWLRLSSRRDHRHVSRDRQL
jgi:hypothetical protein